MTGNRRFGTPPVFFTAISTILGAILFLRFGFAVGTLGFWGVILLVILGHIVTIPTALAISEIATNKRVEGGGEYFIISRSFGLNIGATIGMALYLSQAISVAFYVIAFTESFDFFFKYMYEVKGIFLPRQAISIPVMLFLSSLILKKGANLGVKALYFVVGILAISVTMFFLGSTEYAASTPFNLSLGEFRNADKFFMVFAIVFPAFTGMTAGVGLSGDLKNPGKSIPLGTTLATFTGMILYFFICYKLAASASPEDLESNQLVMADIAYGGKYIVPLGLAAATISSALGSVMVAPRTLQALAVDRSFPHIRINNWLSKERAKDGEPINGSVITCIIALVFVALGDVNAVAEIISMFFMVTYGSLCLISFLNHFGSSPAYRPSFRSRWYLSLIGFLTSVWVMMKINTQYALLAFAIMALLYLYISRYHKERKGLSSIFANAIFQLNKRLKVYAQKNGGGRTKEEWRPSAICISKNSFERQAAYRLLNWISYKYGFGTYLHRIEGYYSKETVKQATIEKRRLVKLLTDRSNFYIDTIISPSYTSAIAQAIQIPGISGMENNMVIFEFCKGNVQETESIIDNFNLVNSGKFDVCILASANKDILYKGGIHIWIKTTDEENSNLMILLSFIILGHPDWKKSNIKIFNICRQVDVEDARNDMYSLVNSGRLPITTNNIEMIIQNQDVPPKSIINEYSKDAGLVIVGFREEIIRHKGCEVFEGYQGVGDVLFVNSHNQKVIK